MLQGGAQQRLNSPAVGLAAFGDGQLVPDKDARGDFPGCEAVAECGAPVVLARTAAGLRPLVGRAELDTLDGSVARLGDLLRARLVRDDA